MNREAMAEGRRRAQRERERKALPKVQKFQAWLAAGSDVRTIPEIPTSREFRLAKKAMLA